MSETPRSKFRLGLSAALGGRQPILRDGVTIEAMTGGSVIQLLSNYSDGAERIAVGLPELSPLALRSLAPGQWLLVEERGFEAADLEALCRRMKPEIEVVDQTHGRVRIRVQGRLVERLLAKGTAVDLALAAFPVGHATTTLFGHIAAHITRIDQDAFEILVLRSFADSFWDDLELMSQEFV